MTEESNYRDYRLAVRAAGPGWRVFIYEPGSSLAFKEMPHTRDKGAREVVIEEAKALVDERIRSKAAPH